MKTILLLIVAATLSSARADIILDFAATAIPPGAVSEALDKSGGRWNANVPLRVESVSCRAALVFDGTQKFISEFGLPAGLEEKPFSVEAWVLNPSIERAETVVALVPGMGGAGTEFSFGSGASAGAGAGAFRSGFKATTPFANLPSEAVWHHLAWTYSSGGAGTLRVYVDGEMDGERALKFTLPPLAKLHVGASGEVDTQSPKKGFSGAIARVRVHDAALSQAELRAGAGPLNAFSPTPRNGATTESLTATLGWQRGAPDAGSFVVYAGADRAAVERGERAIAKRTAAPELGPLPPKSGANYFWRVDQLDKAGRVLAPGLVWSLTADAGHAAEPQPRDRDSNVPPRLAQLAWKPGKYASKQRVYFGASADELERATKPAAESAAGATSFPPQAELAPGTRYFWRIDSDNGAQPPSRGPVWTFRTEDGPVPKDVTFFVGSDTHYGRENNARSTSA
jgi:hypothetical protein